MPHVFRRELVRVILEDPAEGLAKTGLWGVSAFARAQLRREARRRRARLRRAAQPLVSVIVAARNASGLIERSLESILRQTYRELEVVVIDDASDDDTASVVEQAARRDGRVALWRSASQRGPAMARNLGLARARGAYLAFQDADDVSHPERIERQLAALLERPGAVACVCNYRRETRAGQRVVINGRRFAKGAISMLFAREPVLSTLGYLLDVPLGEDAEYAERARAFFGADREVYLFQTLYRAGFSTDSLLFSNGETKIDASHEVSYLRSERVEREMAAVHDRLESIRKGRLDPYVFATGEPAWAEDAGHRARTSVRWRRFGPVDPGHGLIPVAVATPGRRL